MMHNGVIFSISQWIASIWIARVSGLLSICGSAMIIVMILKGGKVKIARIHNRLLLGMCSFDVLHSVAFSASTGASPRSVSHIIYGAYGNEVSCSLQGFLFVLGVAVPLYNANLCIHYLCVIKYNITDEVLKRYEKFMHGVAIGPPLCMAIFAVTLDLIHPTIKGGACWASNGCELVDSESDCTPRPEYHISILKFVLVALVVVAMIIIIFCMTSICLHVYRQSQIMKKYQSFSRGNSMSSPTAHSTRTSGGQNDRNKKKSVPEETLTQALLYVIAYFLCYIIVIISQFMDELNFPLVLLRNAFYPSQGFWNFLIYVRPRFMEIREKKKDESFWWVMKAVFRGGYDKEEERKKKHSLRLNMIRSSNKGISIKEDGNASDRGLMPHSVPPLKEEESTKVLSSTPATPALHTAGSNSSSSHDTTADKKEKGRNDISDDVNSDSRGYNNTPLLMKSPDQLHDNRSSLHDTSSSLLKEAFDEEASPSPLDDEMIVGLPNIDTLHPSFFPSIDRYKNAKQQSDPNAHVDIKYGRRFSLQPMRPGHNMEYDEIERCHSDVDVGCERRNSFPPFPFLW